MTIKHHLCILNREQVGEIDILNLNGIINDDIPDDTIHFIKIDAEEKICILSSPFLRKFLQELSSLLSNARMIGQDMMVNPPKMNVFSILIQSDLMYSSVMTLIMDQVLVILSLLIQQHMKVALCLSGQPRVVDIGYQKLSQAILQHNDVDVFIHTWFDPENLSTQSVIPGRESHTLDSLAMKSCNVTINLKRSWLKNLKVGKDLMVSRTNASQMHGHGHLKFRRTGCSKGIYQQYYPQHVLQHDDGKSDQGAIFSRDRGKYDLVIRNRIDYSPHVVLNLNDISIDDDTLVYQDLNQPDGMISDWFGMGTTNTMNVFCGVYNQIGQLIRQSSEVDGFWCNELLLKHHIENNKIKRAPVDFQVHF